jgi:hypothetical protein
MKFSLNGTLSLTRSNLIFQPHAIVPGLVGQLDMASGKKKLDGPTAHAYVLQLEKASL